MYIPCTSAIAWVIFKFIPEGGWRRFDRAEDLKILVEFHEPACIVTFAREKAASGETRITCANRARISIFYVRIM